jgi:hypothetical protein
VLVSGQTNATIGAGVIDMPKRTNKFQKLVYLFKQQLANEATVSESKFLTDRVTGANVEVDICIEAKIGGDHVIVGVECTKRGRKATLGWVNEMLAKHDSLPTNLLVLASASGFVKNAKVKAESKGAKLIYLSTVSESTVRSIIGELKAVSLVVFEMTMVDVRVRLAPVDGHRGLVVGNEHDYSVFDKHGQPVGALSDLCNALRSSKEFLKGEDKKPSRKRGYVVEWRPGPYFLQSDKAMHPIEKMRMVGTFEIRSLPLKVHNQSFAGLQIAWSEGKAPFLGHDVLMLKTTDSTGAELVSGTIGPVFLPPQKLISER